MVINTGLNKQEVLETIISGGYNIQSLIAMEECAELQKAISKLIRYGDEDKENYDNLVEEMADVIICLEQLKVMYQVSDEELKTMIERKHNRNLRRIYG